MYKPFILHMEGGKHMEKKVWNKPKLTILGIEKTEFDDSYTTTTKKCKS